MITGVETFSSPAMGVEEDVAVYEHGLVLRIAPGSLRHVMDAAFAAAQEVTANVSVSGFDASSNSHTVRALDAIMRLLPDQDGDSSARRTSELIAYYVMPNLNRAHPLHGTDTVVITTSDPDAAGYVSKLVHESAASTNTFITVTHATDDAFVS